MSKTDLIIHFDNQAQRFEALECWATAQYFRDQIKKLLREERS